MKTRYKEGLTRKELFWVFICRLFFWKYYNDFKSDVDFGRTPKSSYEWNIAWNIN